MLDDGKSWSFEVELKCDLEKHEYDAFKENITSCFSSTCCAFHRHGYIRSSTSKNDRTAFIPVDCFFCIHDDCGMLHTCPQFVLRAG